MRYLKEKNMKACKHCGKLSNKQFCSVECRILNRSEVNEDTKSLNGNKCREWKGAVNNCGYGFVFYNNKSNQLAHRASYELFCQEIPAGMVIDHLCGNHKCIEPTHLRVTTQKENVKRRVNKTIRLTFEQVRKIKASTKTAKEIAKEYGILLISVKKILSGKTYKKAC